MTKLPEVPLVLNTSDNDIGKEFYEPCLTWATCYDRGVGYFTSGWLRENAKGMSIFASQGGKARWLISPMLGQKDLEFFTNIGGGQAAIDEALSGVLRRNLKTIQETLENETLNALAWMLFDGIIEFRFALPTEELDGGDFHDKFGIFSDGQGNRISFNGSQNDSAKGLRNYESIKVFPSWRGLGPFADHDQRRFDRLWGGDDHNVKTYALPDAVSQNILELRTEDRPYKPSHTVSTNDKWRHQAEAVRAFLSVGHGILEMATGTGKTRTALKIAERLLARGSIDWVLVTTHGTDLLDQWHKEILVNTELTPFRYYGSHKELGQFRISPANGALLVGRSLHNLSEVLHYVRPELRSRCLAIFDEVHGLGSESLAQTLPGQLSTFGFRLGLSATPEREYDEAGNEFILREIGEVIYRFGLADAIRRGILCEFDYDPLPFKLTEDDRLQMRRLIATHNVKRQQGLPVSDTDLYRDLAMVRKVSLGKLPVFREYLRQRPEVLSRAIIFVGHSEFGTHVQDAIIGHTPQYHTYYAEDDRANLVRFARGELDCLITCHRLSEGIDIKTVDNVILCSADRAQLETIQRIGRCLRVDPNNPSKRARVVDFVEETNDSPGGSSDHERSAWLSAMSATKKEG